MRLHLSRIVAALLLVVTLTSCNLQDTSAVPTPRATVAILVPSATPTLPANSTATPLPSDTPTSPPSPTLLPTDTPTSTATQYIIYLPTRTPLLTATATVMPTDTPLTTATPTITPSPTLEAYSAPQQTAAVPPTRVPAAPTLTDTPPAGEGGNPPPAGQITRGPRGKHEIALTMDAGGASGDVPFILQTLQQRNIHITFFVTGNWVAQNPGAARMIAAAGDEIGNHTYNHLHLPTVKDDAIVAQEVTSAEDEIQSVTGVTPRYFRFPYGEYDKRTARIVNGLGYTSVLWTLDSMDSIGQPKSAQFLIERVTNTKINLDGAIILMHVGLPTSAEALPTILDRLAAKGYQIVTIGELLK